MASLEIRATGIEMLSWTYLLEKDKTILGRSPDCDVVIPSEHTSRKHARILRIDDLFYVEDLDSRGGTRVNGPEPANQILGRTLLRQGDEIWFDSSFIVRFLD